MTIKVAINGYGRIGRNILRAHYESGKKHDIEIVAINDLGNAETNAHLTRYDTVHGKFHGTVEVDGDAMVVNGDRIKVLAQRNPAELPWGVARRRRRARVHGAFHEQGEGGRAPQGRREESHHLRARRQGRRRDGRLRREPQDAEGEPHGDLERVVHDQLPRAAGEGAARQARHRAGPDDDGALLHQRPGADRRLSRGPAPRARGGAEHDPDQDRRRGRGRSGAAGAERQARRLRDPRADDQRLAGRSHVHRGARDQRRGSQRDP